MVLPIASSSYCEAQYILGLHYLHQRFWWIPESNRLSDRVSRRSVHVNRAGVTHPANERGTLFMDTCCPSCLCGLIKSQHVALIGDHKQLPPVITSREAQDKGLGISLFERLTEEGGESLATSLPRLLNISTTEVPSIMLNVQYRMHPAIARFPSNEFYNNLIRDGMVDNAGGIPDRLNPPSSTQLDMHAGKLNRPSVIFLDHAGNESPSDRSRVNWNEAHIVCSVVEDLLLNNPVCCPLA
jgi:hypothetical protein